MHFPGKNIEINAFESLDAAKMLLQPANADERCCDQFAYFFIDSGCPLTNDSTVSLFTTTAGTSTVLGFQSLPPLIASSRTSTNVTPSRAVSCQAVAVIKPFWMFSIAW